MDRTIRQNERQWYVAEIVTHTIIQDDPDAFTTIDTILLAARTEDHADQNKQDFSRRSGAALEK